MDAYAKPLLFITMLVVQVIVGGVFGVLYTLVLWTSEWVPSDTGEFHLVVRATHGDGQQQIIGIQGTYTTARRAYIVNFVRIRATEAS